jgi:hypothetical protein
MAKIIKEVDGECVVGYQFGVKKSILQLVASAQEIRAFKEKVNKKALLFHESKSRGDRWPRWSDLQPIDSELRGYRKYWRTKYTDSFSNGLYRASKKIRWQVGKCHGEFGYSWMNSQMPKGTIFLYVRHDLLGNVELLNSTNNELLKLLRGSGNCESFIKIEEGEKNE